MRLTGVACWWIFAAWRPVAGAVQGDAVSIGDKGVGWLLGRSMRLCPWCWVGGVVFVLLVIGVSNWSDTRQAQRAADNDKAMRALMAQEAARKAAEVEASCQPGVVDARMAQARAAAASDRVHDGVAALQPCRKWLVAGAEPAVLLAQLEARAAKAQARLDRERAQALAKVAAEDAAKRRREGVSIGMSKADVLASSWGRPEQVNATLTARVRREQWVYPGGQYLYFDDDTLTSIQTSR